MSGGLSFGTLIKKQFTGGKLLFHFLFWGLHFGLMAFGW